MSGVGHIYIYTYDIRYTLWCKNELREAKILLICEILHAVACINPDTTPSVKDFLSQYNPVGAYYTHIIECTYFGHLFA